MDVTPYVERLRNDLMAAAEASGSEARELAERLSYALDPAARLALMEAISEAAAEITAELPAGSVEVRLNGRELDFGVQLPLPRPVSPEAEDADEEGDDGALVRITLRIPEVVKTRAEALAARSNQSLNTWLSNVVRRATRGDEAINIDIDLSSINHTVNTAVNEAMTAFDQFRNQKPGNRRMTGWI